MKNYKYEKLKALRIEKGLTQEELADKIGMTQTNYNKLETSRKKKFPEERMAKLAKAFEMPMSRLKAVLYDEKNVQDSGMNQKEMFAVEELLREEPLRADEFIFFSSEVLNIEKHDFKDWYQEEELSMSFFTDVKVIVTQHLQLGFVYANKKLKDVTVWVGEKMLGTINRKDSALVDQLINDLKISRAVLISNEDSIPGYFETYMKVVFIGTNAVCKSANFEKGRFSEVKLLSSEEIERIDNEAFLAQDE